MTQFQKFGTQTNAPKFGRVAEKPKFQQPARRPKPQVPSAEDEQKALFQKFYGEVEKDAAKKQHIAARVGGQGWSFLTACVCTFMATQVLITPYTLFNHGIVGIEENLYENAANTLLMGRYILLLGLSAKILSRIAHAMSVEPRSIYVINGITLGLIMAGGDFVRGDAIQPLSYCLCISGAFGGYMFWRSRGSPAHGD